MAARPGLPYRTVPPQRRLLIIESAAMRKRAVTTGLPGREPTAAGAERERIGGRLENPRIAWTCFGVASVAAAFVIGAKADGTIFVGDDWAYLYRLADWSLASAVFDAPPGQYLIAVPMLIYATLGAVFGADSYLPYRVVGLVLLILASGLFLEYARRRAGYLIGLPAAILLLFFGSAFEVVVIPMRIPSLVATCAGLGMLLKLDRRDRRGDIAACVAGTVAILSHPVALAYLAAAAVRVGFDEPSRRWKRSWVALVPMAVYGLWSITLSESQENALPTTASDVASFAVDFFVAIWGAVTGVFHSPWTNGVDFINGWSALFAVVAVMLAIIVVARARHVSAGLAAALVALAVALISPALAPSGVLRIPESPRYLFPGAIFLFLVGLEVIRTDRPPARLRPLSAGIAVVLFVSAMYSNVAMLSERANAYVSSSAVLKAELAALDLSRPDADVSTPPTDAGREVPGILGLTFASGGLGDDFARQRATAAPLYYAIKDAFGSPADSASELIDAPEPLREQADRVLAATIPIAIREPAQGPVRGQAPTAVRTLSGTTESVDGCLLIRTGDSASAAAAYASRPAAMLSAPPGRLWIRAHGAARPLLRVGRLADQPTFPIEWTSSKRTGSLSLPAAGFAEAPWKLLVYSRGTTTIC